MKKDEKDLQPQDTPSEETKIESAVPEIGEEALGDPFEWDVDALIQDIMSGSDDENLEPLPAFSVGVEDDGPDLMELALAEVQEAQDAKAAAEQAEREAAEKAAAEQAEREAAEKAAAEQAEKEAAEKAAAQQAEREAIEKAAAEQAEREAAEKAAAEQAQREAAQKAAQQTELPQPDFLPPEELLNSSTSQEEKASAIHQVIHQPRRRNRRVRKRNFLGYFIAEGFRGIFSHRFMSFAAASIITVCLLLLGSFSLVTLNLDYNLENVMSRNQFYAYVDETYSEEDARALESQIQAVENVAEVTFITREEAKANFAEDESNSAQIESLPDSVFRHRYSVMVDDLEQLDATIEQVSQIEGIADISADRDLADKLVMIRNAFAIVAVVLVGSLLLISLFIIYNTIKLATVGRQQEIAIMKMCGATNGFIRWPFIYEGAILGLVGSGVAYGLEYAIYYGIMQVRLTALGELVRIISWGTVYLYVLALFLGVGLIIGMFGSVLAIRKFLKV